MRPNLKAGLFTFAILVSIGIGLPTFIHPSAYAQPILQNSNTECPPNTGSIWVRLDTNNRNDPKGFINIPFNSGYDTTDVDGPGPDRATGYINYLAGVLITEVGTTSYPDEGTVTFDDKLLQGMSILARTVAYKNCQTIGWGNYSHGGMDDSEKQQYDPIKARDDYSSQERQRYLDAVADTDDIYLTYNGKVFDAQYRDISGSFSADLTDPPNDPDGKNPPHRSVFDSPGVQHNASAQPGLAQINANHYATGKGHDRLYPIWGYKQTLAHSYSAAEFQGLSIPNDYRFNLLWLNDRDDGPMYLRRGREYYFPAILQNSGANTWQLTPTRYCRPESYASRYLALGLHWYNLDGDPEVFEGSRTVLCDDDQDPYLGTTSLLEAGGEYPAQSRPSGGTRTANVYVSVPNDLSKGTHFLAFDLEFRSPHNTLWASRLESGMNMSNAQWPTQNFRVEVGPNSHPHVSDLYSSSHNPDVWSHNSTVTIHWDAPDDDIGVKRYYYRWSGLTDWRSTTSEEITSSLPDGEWTFEVYSEANDGQTSNEVSQGPFKIDTSDPVALFSFNPAWVTATSFPVDWSGSYDTGSGDLRFDLDYRTRYELDPAAPWSEWVRWQSNTSATSATFDNAADDTLYQFRLVARDEAGNEDANYAAVSVRTLPYLAAGEEPAGLLNWTIIYSDTQPRTGYLRIANEGGGTMDWNLDLGPSFPWLEVGQPTSGSGGPNASWLIPLTLTHSSDIGLYTTTLTVTAAGNARRTPIVLKATIRVVEHYDQFLPVIFKEETP